jgi:HAD superfamily hydrolase (TIGR01549 family)
MRWLCSDGHAVQSGQLEVESLLAFPVRFRDVGRKVMGRLHAVFFDVGETLVDESREYGTWADWLGVPRHTFSAVFGAVIARGGDYRETFQHFQAGFDLAAERERRAAAGQPESFGEANLYPDTRPCLAALRSQRLLVGLAGNQTTRAEDILRSLGLPVDVIGTSDGWGAEKPSAAFFERLITEAGCPAGEILYVGDRLDNDVAPAQRHGIATAFLRRGPWGYILHDENVLAQCLFRLESLIELPDLVAKHNSDAD